MSFPHIFSTAEGPLSKLPLPPWLCQPYVRIPAEEHLKKLGEAQKRALKRQQEEKNIDEDSGIRKLSKKKLKKMHKNPNKKFDQLPPEYEKCSCKNPRVSVNFFIYLLKV